MFSNIVRQFINAYAKELAEEGKKLIDKSFATADFNKNRTQNLHDSYGSCVFYDGKEVPNTRRYVGRKATIGKKNPQGELILGRAEVDAYFDAYKPKSKGFELVAVAAIFYAEILEKGKGKLRHKYKVITGLSGDMDDLAKLTGGRVVNINL